MFAGPGSPSYALRQWLGTAVPDLLAAKLRDGGCVTLASAAAVGLGVRSLPVYEVYKVGEDPRWLVGLDLLGVTGLRAAVIPHYNNAEGGTHDTRYCYMGERRLRILEELLPEGVDILGVDEHTAAIFDIDGGPSHPWARRPDMAPQGCFAAVRERRDLARQRTRGRACGGGRIHPTTAERRRAR